MPVGVRVQTSTRSAPATPQRNAASSYMVVGQTERGSLLAPTKVTSMSDVERLLGGYVSYGFIYRDLLQFFEEGGTVAYVQRVAGPAATKGTKILLDRAGTPLSTLTITALSEGPHSSNITVAVVAGTLAGTYQLQIGYTGIGNTGTEVYDNLATPADAVSALQNSAYVRASDNGSATAAPNNIPALLAAAPLSAGSGDTAAVGVTQYTAGLALLSEDLGAGAVAVPGIPSATIGAALVAHASTRNRLALTAVANSSTSSQATAAVAALRIASPNGLEHVGLFWPNVMLPDGKGGKVTVTPEGFVAACRARAHEAEGPARAPAGIKMGQAQFILGVETVVPKSTVDTVNDSGVSVIAVKNNIATLYGWRSLSADSVNYRLLTSRDVINYVTVVSQAAQEQYVYRTIDSQGRLYSEMRATETGILEPLRQASQLFEKYDANGNLIDPGYAVDTGPSVNTPTTTAANQANIAVAVRPSPSAELINVSVIKVDLNGSL